MHLSMVIQYSNLSHTLAPQTLFEVHESVIAIREIQFIETLKYKLFIRFKDDTTVLFHIAYVLLF